MSKRKNYTKINVSGLSSNNNQVDNGIINWKYIAISSFVTTLIIFAATTVPTMVVLFNERAENALTDVPTQTPTLPPQASTCELILYTPGIFFIGSYAENSGSTASDLAIQYCTQYASQKNPWCYM